MTKEKASSKLFWNLFFIYTANIIGKTSFSAATAALVSEEILTKTEAGIIGGGFWLLYAIGQFLGAFLVNKMSPYTMIHICIAGATISNFLIRYFLFLLELKFYILLVLNFLILNYLFVFFLNFLL